MSADIEVALMAFFDDLAYTVTSTPSDLEERLDGGQLVLRIKRIGGGSEGQSDNPIVSIQSFASSAGSPDRAAEDVYDRPAHALDRDVEDQLLALVDEGPAYAAETVLEDPEKTSGPVELLYPNPAISVVESIYRLTTRR